MISFMQLPVGILLEGEKGNLMTCENFLTLLSIYIIYTHFNTLKKKVLENMVEKGEIAQHEQFHLFPQCFLYNQYLKIL